MKHRLGITAISTLAGLLAGGSALGHVPFLEQEDYSFAQPYVVKDVTNSKSIHAALSSPDDVDVYLIQIDQPTRIYTTTNVPFCPQFGTFGVTYALTGPGLPAPDIELPFELPAGHGAVVVRDQPSSAAERPTWLEPFSGRQMYTAPEYALDDAPPGDYRMIVWSERGETGNYIAVIGEAEIFNAPEIMQVRATSPLLKHGQNLMVDCDPTVAEPQPFRTSRD